MSREYRLTRHERKEARQAFHQRVQSDPNHWFWRELAANESSALRCRVGQEVADAILYEQYGFSEILATPNGTMREVYEFLKGQVALCDMLLKEDGPTAGMQAITYADYIASKRYLAAVYGYGDASDLL